MGQFDDLVPTTTASAPAAGGTVFRAPDGSLVSVPAGATPNQIQDTMATQHAQVGGGGSYSPAGAPDQPNNFADLIPEPKSDEGLGFADALFRPIDNVSGWADAGLQKLGVPMDAINHGLGFPTQAEQVGAHMRALTDAAAQGVKPGDLGEMAGSLAASAPLLFSGVGPMAGGAAFGAADAPRGADLSQVLLSAGASALGGKATDLGLAGLSSVVKPILSPEVQALADSGVKMTSGQARPGVSLPSALELMSKGLPGAGEMARSAQNASLDSFNAAAARQAVKPIGATIPDNLGPAEAFDAARKAVGAHYNSIGKGSTVPLDEIYAGRMAGLRADAADLPDSLSRRFDKVLQSVSRRQDPAVQGFTSDGLMQAKSTINSALAKVPAMPSMDEMDYSEALKGARKNLFDLLGRAVPGADAQLAAGDAAYQRLMTVRAARLKGETTGPQESGTNFTPDQLLMAIRQRSSPDSIMSGDAPMKGFADAAKDVLPKSYQKAASIGHALQEGAVTLGVGGGELIPGNHHLGLAAVPLAGILGGLYSKPAQAGMRYLLSGSRPAIAGPIADAISGARPAASSIGAVLGALAAQPGP